MDKRVMYALMGGVAVVGAAVAYSVYAGKAEQETDTIEDDLAAVGEPQYEANGMLKFEYFLQIFHICSFYGKN